MLLGFAVGVSTALVINVLRAARRKISVHAVSENILRDSYVRAASVDGFAVELFLFVQV